MTTLLILCKKGILRQYVYIDREENQSTWSHYDIVDFCEVMNGHNRVDKCNYGHCEELWERT